MRQRSLRQLPAAHARRADGSDWADTGGAEEWGFNHNAVLQGDMEEYLDDDSVAGFGFEWVGSALAILVILSFLKVMWYLLVVCWTLLATAFQYSVLAIALMVAVLAFG